MWKMGSVLKPDLPGHIDQLDYHEAGEYLVAGCSAADRLYFVDSLQGCLLKTINSKKFGAKLPVFTHHPQCILYASKDGMVNNHHDDGDIHLLSFHDNVILKRFTFNPPSPSSLLRVDSISVNPQNDVFMVSGSNGVKLFDMNNNHGNPIASLDFNSKSKVLSAFDPQGLIFAVFKDNKTLSLYDFAGYERGPFAMFDFVDPYVSRGLEEKEDGFNSLKFSPDGKLIMINNTNTGHLHIIDSFEGECCASISYGKPLHPFSADWLQDSGSIVIGGEDNKVHMYSAQTFTRSASLEGHTSYPLSVAVNPRYNTFASACSNIALWLQ